MKINKNSSSIKAGAVISYVAIFLNIAISFLYTPWMIKKIGVSDYGLYSLIISFISYFIMDFGLSSAIQRFIAKYRAEGNEDGVAMMVGLTTRVYLIIDTVIFLVLFILYFFIANIFTGLTPEEIDRLKGLYIIAGCFSVLTFLFKPMAGAMMAYEYFVEERVLEMVNKVGVVLLICVALVLGADVYALVLINGAVSLVTSILKFLVFRYKSKLKIQWSFFDKAELKSIFSFSMWTFGSGLAQRMRLSLIPSILGIISNSQEIACFALGMSLEGMVFTFSNGINGLFLPKVSRMSYMQKRDDILNLMIQIGRIQLFIFCSSFLNLWVGEDFSSVYYVVVFLITSNVLSLTQTIANDLVFVENRVRDTASRILVTSIAGLAVACLLARNYGAVGCAIGTGVGMCLYLMWINIYYYKQMGIDVLSFFRSCHLIILPILCILCIISYFIISLFTLNSWFKLVIFVGIYFIVYVLVCYLLLFNTEEKKLMKFGIRFRLSKMKE